jgi:hypothetical protein
MSSIQYLSKTGNVSLSSPSKVTHTYTIEDAGANMHKDALNLEDQQVSYQSGTDAAALSKMTRQQIHDMELHSKAQDEYQNTFSRSMSPTKNYGTMRKSTAAILAGNSSFSGNLKSGNTVVAEDVAVLSHAAPKNYNSSFKSSGSAKIRTSAPTNL